MAGGYNLGSASGRITIVYDGSGAKHAKSDLDDVRTRGGKTGTAVKEVGSQMGKAGLAIAAGLGYAVTKAVDFEKQISAIGAVSGATGPQMEQIRQLALKIGADTQYSASEAANAIEELAKAGVPLPAIMHGAADATVALAAAGGVSLPQAATIASNAMNAFGISAGKMPHIADLIAGAANASAIDVGEFGQSLQQAGAVAHLQGVSFDDLSTAIALLGNAGIKGSDAGTSLKTMLQNLNPQTDKARNLMHKLGLITEDGANKFYDAHGKMKSLSDVAGLLQHSLKGMTAQQKSAALQTIFGTDALRAAAIVADNGSKGFDNMAKSIGKVSASDVAKTRMDNLAGSVEQLKGQLETAAITVGSALLPTIKDLTKYIGKLLDKWDSLSATQQQQIAKYAAIAAAVLLAAGSIATIVRIMSPWVTLIRTGISGLVGLTKGIIGTVGATARMVQGFRNAAVAQSAFSGKAGSLGGALRTGFNAGVTGAKAIVGAVKTAASAIVSAGRSALVFGANMTKAGVAAAATAVKTVAVKTAQLAVAAATKVWAAVQWVLDAALNANPIGLIVIAIAALVAGIILAYKHSATFRAIVQGAFKGIMIAVKAVVSFFTGTVWPAIKVVFNAIVSGAKAIAAPFIGFFNLVAPLFKAFFDLIISVAKLWWSIFSAFWTVVFTVLKALFTLYLNIITTVWKTVWNGLVTAVTFVWNLIKTIVTAAFNFIVAGIRFYLNLITTVWNAVWGALVTAFTVVWNAIKTALSAAWNFIVAGFNFYLGIIKTVWNTVWGAVSTFLITIWNGIKGYLSAAWNFISSTARSVFGAVKGFFTTVWNSIYGFIKTVVSAIVNFFTSRFRTAKANITAVFNGIKSAAQSIWNGILNIIKGAVNNVVSVINGIRRIVDKVRSFFNQLKAAASGGTGSLISFVKGIPGRVVSALGRLGSRLYGAGKQLIQGMINGVRDAVGGLVSAAENVVGSAISAAKKKLHIGSPSRVFRYEVGQMVGAGMILGLDDMVGQVNAASRRLASGAIAVANAVPAAAPNVAGTLATAAADYSALPTMAASAGSVGAPVINYNIDMDVNVPNAMDPSAVGNYTTRRLLFALGTGTTADNTPIPSGANA